MRTLYNHYISDDLVFDRIPEAEYRQRKEEKKSDFNLFNLFSKEKEAVEKDEKNAGISGILKRFHLENIDPGDILLVLILIFLIIEGSNWELAIILGLVLFLSLRSDSDADELL